MFFNYFKDYFLKKKLKNYLSNVGVLTSDNKVDETKPVKKSTTAKNNSLRNKLF